MKEYLERFYPKNNPFLWHSIRMVYINEHHKSKFFEAVEIVTEYDKKKASDLVINGNGCFTNSFWDWIRILDPKLKELHTSLETHEIMKKHFEIDF